MRLTAHVHQMFLGQKMGHLPTSSGTQEIRKWMEVTRLNYPDQMTSNYYPLTKQCWDGPSKCWTMLSMFDLLLCMADFHLQNAPNKLAFVELCERSAWNLHRQHCRRSSAVVFHVSYLHQTKINKDLAVSEKGHVSAKIPWNCWPSEGMIPSKKSRLLRTPRAWHANSELIQASSSACVWLRLLRAWIAAMDAAYWLWCMLYMSICIYAYMYSYLCVCIHICEYVYMYICICICICVCIGICIHVYMRICVYCIIIY